MTRIRFCHVIDGSGSNPLLYNSIKYSDREKFEYSVFSLQPEGDLHKQMAELGVPAYSLDYRSRKQAPAAVLRLFRYFRKEKIRIVQTHLFDASLIGLSAALLAGVPVRVFTGHHSHETPLHRRRVLTFVDGASGRFLANHTIAPSEQMKEIFVRDLKVPAEKIAVIHHGFDLDAWRTAARAKGGFRSEYGVEGKIVFGAVGRLFWVKNFENLILGFADATKGRDDTVLVIAGGGDTSELQRLVQTNHLEGRMILAGRREDIAPVMNEFDVLIHASLAESFGMIFIEAAALAKPIASTPVGVFPEINSDGKIGVQINGNDRESIANAIRETLERRETWSEMSAIGVERSNLFEVSKTQAVCDAAYLRWLGKR